MKSFRLTLAVVAVSTLLSAQTNSPPAPVMGQSDTQIFSESWSFDLNTRQIIYQGNVRVENAQMKLACETMTTIQPDDGRRVDRIVAETNVAVDLRDEKGQTNHATGQKLVYTYKVEDGVTNEIVTLTVSPRVETQDFWSQGDADAVMTFDLTNGKFSASGKTTSGTSTNQQPRDDEQPTSSPVVQKPSQ